MGRLDQMLRCTPLDDGVDLRLDEPFGIDEARYLHGGKGWTDIAEHLTVNRTYHLPIFDASEQDTCADDVGERCPELLQSNSRNFKAPPSLRGGITDAHRLTVRTDRSRAGNTNNGPDTYPAGKADQRLIRATSRDAQAFEV